MPVIRDPLQSLVLLRKYAILMVRSEAADLTQMVEKHGLTHVTYHQIRNYNKSDNSRVRESLIPRF